MKNIKYFILAILSFSLLNCSSEDDNGQVAYNGAPFLNFLNQGGEQNVNVVSNTNSNVVTVKVGTFAPVTGTHTVKIIPDLVNATAVLNVDYKILNETAVLENGSTVAEFKIEFFKDPAVETGKTVSFTLESDLQPAVFNTKHVINVRLTCPLEALEGLFEADSYLYGRKQYTITRAIAGASQITIKDFWEDYIGEVSPTGAIKSDFVIGFNESNFVIPSLARQNTGRFRNGREIQVLLNTALVSRLNACTRRITLNLTYRIPVEGSATAFTNEPVTETFIGIIE